LRLALLTPLLLVAAVLVVRRLLIQLLAAQVVKILFLVLLLLQVVVEEAHGVQVLTLKLAVLAVVHLNRVQELLVHKVFLVKEMLVVRLETQTLAVEAAVLALLV
jgi:hypothetical protein